MFEVSRVTMIPYFYIFIFLFKWMRIKFFIAEIKKSKEIDPIGTLENTGQKLQKPLADCCV